MHVGSVRARRWREAERTLANQDCSVHADRSVRTRDETSVDGGDGGDERCTCKAMGIYYQRCATPWMPREMKHLIPVVTATWPRRLNQPQIHEAKGAFFGVDSIAAQKYGPPLVGWALQISGKCQQRRRRVGSGGKPAIAKPTVIVKTVLRDKSSHGRGGIIFHPQATTTKPQTITTGPPVFWENSSVSLRRLETCGKRTRP